MDARKILEASKSDALETNGMQIVRETWGDHEFAYLRRLDLNKFQTIRWSLCLWIQDQSKFI